MRSFGAVALAVSASCAFAGCRERASTAAAEARDPTTGRSSPSSAPIGAVPSSVPAGAAGDARSPVLVAIVVDQLAAWIADERWPKLAADGGFRRLVREGTWVKSLRYAHAAADTAPGHAALYTGAVPRASGIFGNEIVDERQEVFSVLRDPAATIVYPGVREATVSSSASRLRVDTVADRLRAAHPDAFVVSLSIKDRGAILPAGKHPTAAVWFDTKLVRFVTSTAFAPELPAWVERVGSPSSVMRALEQPWERAVDRPVPTPDQQPGEGDESGLGRTFPHRLDATSAPGRVFRTVPAADNTLLAMALDALDASDSRDVPSDRRRGAARLIQVSLSAHDYVGHVFGPDSWEAWDELTRLDRALATFFSELDRRYGAEGWAALLSGDHGTTTMPEATRVPGVRHWCAPRVAPAGVGSKTARTKDRYERPCGPAYRLDLDVLSKAVGAAAQRALPGKKDLVRGLADPYVFVGEGARSLTSTERAKLDVAIRSVLEATPGVRRVFAVDALPTACPPIEADDSMADEARLAALVCRSVYPRNAEQSGGYYVVTAPGSFFDPRIVRGFGTSHGTPYLYDRTVPLVVRALGRVPKGRVIEEAVDFRAFARTASALLGVDPPPAAAPGRDLTK